MQKTTILQRVWFRALLTCVLGIFATIGVVSATVTLSTDIDVEDGAVYVDELGSTAGNAVFVSDEGKYGDALGWEPDQDGDEVGFWFEFGGFDGGSESAGMFANDDYLALWSPGDDIGILGVYDEDDLSAGPLAASPVFLIDTSGWVGILDDDDSISAFLDVGGSSANHIDGNQDAIIADDLEVDGNAFFDSDVWFYQDLDVASMVLVGPGTSNYLDLAAGEVLIADELEVDGSVFIGTGSIDFVNDGVGDLLVGDDLDVNGIAYFSGNVELGDGGGIIYVGNDATDVVNVNGDMDVYATPMFHTNTGFEADLLVEIGAGGPDLFFVDTAMGIVEMGDLDVALGNGAFIEIDMFMDWIGIGGDPGSGGVMVQIGDDPSDMVGLVMNNNGTGGLDIGPDAGFGPPIATHYSIPSVIATSMPGVCIDTPAGSTGSVGMATTVIVTPEDPSLAPLSDITWYGWSDAMGTAVIRVCDFTGMAAPGTPFNFNVDIWMH